MAYFTLESMLLVDNNIIRQKKQNQMINSIAPWKDISWINIKKISQLVAELNFIKLVNVICQNLTANNHVWLLFSFQVESFSLWPCGL